MPNNGGCQQLCVNELPGFVCDCRAGYTLDMDGFNCSGRDVDFVRHNFNFGAWVVQMLMSVPWTMLAVSMHAATLKEDTSVPVWMGFSSSMQPTAEVSVASSIIMYVQLCVYVCVCVHACVCVCVYMCV